MTRISASAESSGVLGAHRALFVAQLLLTAAVVGLARIGLGARTLQVLVVGMALLNSALVGVVALGLRRQWWPTYVVAAVMVVVGAALLAWPAWGHYDRVRLP